MRAYFQLGSPPPRIAYVSLAPDRAAAQEPGAWDPGAVPQAFRRLGYEVELFRPDGQPGFQSTAPGVRRHLLQSSSANPNAPTEDGLDLNPPLSRELDQVSHPRWSTARHDHGFSLLYEHHSPWSYAAMEWARHHHVPAVLEIQSPMAPADLQVPEPVLALAARAVTQRAFAAANTIVVHSQRVADWAHGAGASTASIQVLDGAVDPETYARLPVPGTSAAGTDHPGVVGLVGSVVSDGSLHTALDGIRRGRELSVIRRIQVVADASEYQRVRVAAAGLGLAELLDWTDRSDTARVVRALGRMDIVVLAEGQGALQPLVEAMAAARPILAGRSVGAGHLLKHAQTAWLVDSANPSAIGAALSILLRCPRLLTHLGTNSRTLALRSFSWTAILDRLLASALRPLDPDPTPPESPPAGPPR